MQSKSTVLVVDDNESIKELLKNFLTEEGYTVVTASDARLALDKLKQLSFDLVISDIMMPEISGIDLLVEVRKLAPDLPMVMITGYPTIDTAVKVIKEGANDFITKPFNLDHARHVVTKVIEGGRLRKQNRLLTNKMKEVDKIKAMSRHLEEKVSELSSLYTISDVLHHTFTTAEVFVKAIEVALSVTEAEKGAFWIFDKINKDIVLHANKGIEGLSGSRTALADSGFIEKVLNGKDRVVDQDYKDCICGGDNEGHKHPFLCVPVVIGGEIFAALQICSKVGGSDFTQNDISLISNLAQKSALRLENLALYENLVDNIFKSVTSLVTAIDARDNYTMNHCKRVTFYAVSLAKGIAASDEICDAFSIAGPVHDVGKIGVRDDILLKPGRLNKEEIIMMRDHAAIGDDIIGHLNFGPLERAIVRNHHERFNGSGYPDGFKHDEIPLVARIFSVVDTYDAMTTNRPYRTALTHQQAIDELVKYSGDQFDGDLVKEFLRLDIGKDESGRVQ